MATTSQSAGMLTSTVGQVVASVGTGTCALRRGRRVRPEDRERADNAVSSARATRAETGMEEVTVRPITIEEEDDVPVSHPIPEVLMMPDEEMGVVPVSGPASEVVAVALDRNETFPLVSLSSVGSFRSVQGPVSSTASISTLLRAMPAKKFVIRSAFEDVELDSSSSDDTVED